MDVIVVGAGLAGLAAAHRLTQAGERVRVLEANDRVGGRCRSTTLANGTAIERGGEFIDPEQHVIRRFCAELQLPLVPHAVDFFRRRQPDGSVPSVADLERTMTQLRDAAWHLTDDISVRKLFESTVDVRQRAILDRIETSSAADADSLSSAFGLAAFHPPQIDHASRVWGGNDRIARELARLLGDRVELRTPVRAIRPSNDRVLVLTDDGSEVAADAVVVAVPLPLVQQLDWAGGLPEQWAPGLDQLGFGDAAKLSVALRRPAKPRAVSGEGRRWWSWNSAGPSDRELSVPAVSCFAGTPGQVDALETEAGAATWLDALRTSRRDLDLVDQDHVLTTWRSEPWARGAYSYARVGWDADAAVALQSPVGRMVLAGEHTAGTIASTMNGALASGERAARVVREVA